MRQVFVLASGLLIFAGALIFSFSPCPAGELSPSAGFQSQRNPKLSSDTHQFDILTSQSFFLFSRKYPAVGYGNRSNVYYPWSVAITPEYRSLEEKINNSLLPLLQYPGGAFVCDAVQAGFEFLTYSKEMTTYGYGNFYTVFEINRSLSGRRNLRTGIFFNF